MLTDNNEVIQRIGNATSFNYSEEQLKVLNSTGGMCILACAGAGKTTVLTHLLAKRILSGEIQDTSKLLCTTYSKSGATEMEERLHLLFKKVGIHSKVTVKTLHAFYLMILKKFGFSTDVVDGGTRLRLITESCREARVVLGDDDLNTIDSLLSYQVNNLMSDSALMKSYVYTLENVSQAQFTAIRMGYNKRKQDRSLLDFDDMQLYIYTVLVKQGREDILAYCRSMWTDFYIDEAQDISKIQFEILRKLITDPSKVVFIGDDDQSIYQWRGADPSIILNICGYYDINKFILSTNYRCYGNIVRPASVGIAHNTNREEKTMKPYQEGGQIRVVDTHGGDLYNQSKYAYQHIRDLVINDGVQPDNIAVLSRNNQHLAILNNLLFKEGIYCESTRDMRFTSSNMYKDIKNVIELASDGYNHNITSSTLWRICPYLGTVGSKGIADIQKSSGIRLSDTLGYILNNFTSYTVIWNGEFKLPPTVNERIRSLCYRFKGSTLSYLKSIYELLTQAKYGDVAVGFIGLYKVATEFMYKTKDRRRSIDGICGYIVDMIGKHGIDRLKELLRVSEQFESGSLAVTSPKICMSTMHGAKGREWEHVVIFADDNVTFPSFEGINMMLSKSVSNNDICSSLDEDRRLHYVALTRAKKDLTIFTDSSNTSIYTLEALGVFNPNKGTSNAHIINMAKQESVYGSTVDIAKESIFKEGSPYYYKIELENIKEPVEFGYNRTQDVENKESDKGEGDKLSELLFGEL